MIASLISLMGAIDLPHLVRSYSTMYEKAISSEMSQADNESSTQRVPRSRHLANPSRFQLRKSSDPGRRL